jgi:hypothetical protein
MNIHNMVGVVNAVQPRHQPRDKEKHEVAGVGLRKLDRARLRFGKDAPPLSIRTAQHGVKLILEQDREIASNGFCPHTFFCWETVGGSPSSSLYAPMTLSFTSASVAGDTKSRNHRVPMY